ncbi:hypothetical protein GYB22_08805 [bacterium]|nr:hypothetical protein [bacterium]
MGKRLILFAFTILLVSFSFGQADSASTDLEPIWEIPSKDAAEVYIDSVNAYRVIIPEWLELIDFRQEGVWGGVMPDTFQTRNALTIKSYPKDSFLSKSDFIMYVYGHVQVGKSPFWNSGFICTHKQMIPDYQFLGYQGYHLQLFRNGTTFLADYIITETSESYIWIDFTSTDQTHDLNQVKMFEFLRGFQVIE